MITIGLTGSIGMGKSTTAKMFADAGAALWDADAAVHRLYAKGGAGVRAIEALAPAAVKDGAVDRSALREVIMAYPDLLKKVEVAVHPLVAADRAAFIEDARGSGAEVAVLDIPLIFETGAQKAFDYIVVASAPPDIQKSRVLERPGMTEEAFAAILAKQTPDEVKRAGADFVVDTGAGMDAARKAVRDIMVKVTESDRA